MNTLMWSTVFSEIQGAHVRKMGKISSQEAKDISFETFRPLHLGLSWLLVNDPQGIYALKWVEA